MTKTKQDKSARPAAVELHEAALDQAVGGGEEKYYTITLTNARTVDADGSVKPITDGTSNTVPKG